MTFSVRTALEYGVRIAFILAAAAFAYSVWRPADPTSSDAPASDVIQLSEPIRVGLQDLQSPLHDGGVRILEFADFECPFCVRYAKETLPYLRAEFSDRGLISYEFRHLPLEAIHPHALLAARAAECARVQKEFWRFHDRLLELSAALTPAQIQRVGESAVPDSGAFQRCLQDSHVDLAIESDRRLAAQLGIRSTPSFVLLRGTQDGPVAVATITGALPIETFRKAIQISAAPRGSSKLTK